MTDITLVEQIDNLYTTTWRHMKREAADNTFDSTPFWFWLKNKGKLKTMMGGRSIQLPIIHNKLGTSKWLTKGDTTALSDKEILTATNWDWRYLAIPIVRFGIDDQQNRGKMQIINYMNAKLTNAKNELVDTLESALFGAAGSATNKIDGLQHLVANDPTAAATVGNIDQSTHTYWRNKTKNMTGISFAAEGVNEMRTMYNDCSQNRTTDSPDILVTSQTIYEYYEEEVLESYYRTMDRTLADAGFKNQSFKDVPMVWSPSCPESIYFLNTNFIQLTYDPMYFFDMTKWKEIPSQVNDRVAQIIVACSFNTNRRRVLGVMHTVDTP